MAITYNTAAEYHAARNEYIDGKSVGNDPVFDAAFNAAVNDILAFSANDKRCFADFAESKATGYIAFAVANIAMGNSDPYAAGNANPNDITGTYQYRCMYDRDSEPDVFVGLAVAAASVISTMEGDMPDCAADCTGNDGSSYADRVAWGLAGLPDWGLGFPIHADGNDSNWHETELLWGYYERIA